VAYRSLRCVPVRLGSRLLCAALVACALVLASCGGGGSSDDGGAAYVERVNKAQQDFAARVDELSKGISSTSSAARDRQTLKSFETAVDEVGGDLRAIKPPEKVRGLHDQLVQAVDGYGDDVTTAAEALNSGSPSKLRAAQRELAQATTAFGTTLNETIDRINKTLNG
jgi:predicted small secreted protein